MKFLLKIAYNVMFFVGLFIFLLEISAIDEFAKFSRIFPVLIFAVSGLKPFLQYSFSFKYPEVTFFSFFFLFIFLHSFCFYGLGYKAIADVFVSGIPFFLFWGIVGNCEEAPSRGKSLFYLLSSFVFISAIFFLLEHMSPLFSLLRIWIYESTYTTMEDDLIERFTSEKAGLSPFLFAFGYHLSIVLPISISQYFCSDSSWSKLRSVVCLSLGLIAMQLAAERSVLLSVALSLAFFLIFQPFGRRLLRTIAVPFFTLILLGVVFTFIRGFTLGPTLSERLEKSPTESLFRLQLQKRALELVVEYPFGINIAGKDWNNAGYYYVKREYPTDSYSKPVAVHNSYLRVGLIRGVVVLLLSGFWMLFTALRCVYVLRYWARNSHSPFSNILLGSCLSGVSVFSFQSSLHNRGLFYQDRSSILIFALLFLSTIYMQKHSLTDYKQGYSHGLEQH